MTASTPDRADRSVASTVDPPAVLLRLVARRHVDLHRVASALCR